MPYESGQLPQIIHQPLLRRRKGNSTVAVFFPLQPVPAALTPGALYLTKAQIAILRALSSWHWKYCPTQKELMAMTGIKSRGTTIQRTLAKLRELGFIEWLDGEDRTLHLTPLGQSLVGMYVGALRNKGANPLESYQADSLIARSVQRRILRARYRVYWCHRKGRVIPRTDVHIRQWALPERDGLTYVLDRPGPRRVVVSETTDMSVNMSP